MQSPNSLLQLPDAVLINLFSQWLEVKALVRLDSAACSRQSSPRFCDIAGRTVLQENVGMNPYDRLSYRRCQWLVRRQVKGSDFTACSRSSINIAIVQMSGAILLHLRWVDPRPIPIVFAEQFVDAICTHCNSLLSFTLLGLILGEDSSRAAQNELHDRLTARIVRSSTHLRELEVDITDTGIGILRKLPISLRSLSFTEDFEQPPSGPVAEGEGELFAQIPYLQTLYLHDADPELVRGVVKHCTQLVSICLWYAGSVTDQQWRELITSSPLLRKVDFHECAQLSTETMRLLHNLEKLCIAVSSNLDDATVHHIAQRSPHLRQLYLEGCPNITYALFADAFLDNAACLEILNIAPVLGVREEVEAPLKVLLESLLRYRYPRLQSVVVDRP